MERASESADQGGDEQWTARRRTPSARELAMSGAWLKLTQREHELRITSSFGWGWARVPDDASNRDGWLRVAQDHLTPPLPGRSPRCNVCLVPLDRGRRCPGCRALLGSASPPMASLES